MRKLLLMIILIMNSGCQKNVPSLTTQFQRDPKWVLADEIYNYQIGRKVFLQLEKEKNLHVCESGWGLRGKKAIRVMHCAFNYYDEIDINGARKLLMDAAISYLREINDNIKIRSYLYNHPFAPKDIEIRIFFFNPDGSLKELEKLAIVRMIDGKLEYDVNLRLEDGEIPLTTIYEETYEEALAKLDAEYANINQSVEKSVELPSSEIFTLEKSKHFSLKGKIVNGRYYAPKQYLEELKKDILNFRKTFEFGAIPDSSIDKKDWCSLKQ